MNKIFIDTNIIIDYSKGHTKQLKNLFNLKKDGKISLYTNAIVFAEYFTDKNLHDKKKLGWAYDLFQIFINIDISKEIGLLAGQIMRNNQTPLIADAIIAATCLHHNLVLATNNKRDFRKVKGLAFFTYT